MTTESKKNTRDDVTRNVGREVDERAAFAWARSNQGFEGDFPAWMALSTEDRLAYEDGAAGIGTE